MSDKYSFEFNETHENKELQKNKEHTNNTNNINEKNRNTNNTNNTNISANMVSNIMTDIAPIHSNYEIKKRPSWCKTFMNIVEIIAERSLCLKLKTASIVVRGSQIISIGYNGTFCGSVECNEFWFKFHKEKKINTDFAQWIETDEFKKLHREWSKSYEIHAEANALRWVANAGDNVLYTLYSPCHICMKDIISHGCKIVYYKYRYKHDNDSCEILQSVGIKCIQIE